MNLTAPQDLLGQKKKLNHSNKKITTKPFKWIIILNCFSFHDLNTDKAKNK